MSPEDRRGNEVEFPVQQFGQVTSHDMTSIEFMGRLISPVWDYLNEVMGGAEGDVSYASFFFAGRFACFNATIALTGDPDGEDGMLKTVPDGIRDHRIADHL
jgi:hypothetical protein